jgi:preprotein translocase subunit SecF
MWVGLEVLDQLRIKFSFGFAFVVGLCHNSIFTLGIFSGVGMQNKAAQAEPA